MVTHIMKHPVREPSLGGVITELITVIIGMGNTPCMLYLLEIGQILKAYNFRNYKGF